MKTSKNAHFFPVIPPPPDASDDGECINFGHVGKTFVQAYLAGPEYKTQLLIEHTDPEGHFDYIPLDIVHLSSFNRFNVSFEAMGKTDCLKKLKKLIQVVKSMPAVGIPRPQQTEPKMPVQTTPPLALPEGRAA